MLAPLASAAVNEEVRDILAVTLATLILGTFVFWDLANSTTADNERAADSERAADNETIAHSARSSVDRNI